MLELKDIQKKYKREILKGVNFSVSEGEIVGIVGANGCGKSTIVSIITNSVKADSGDVIIDGEDTLSKNFDISKYIGYVPQENCLFNRLTVKQNIEFWSKANKLKYSNLYFDSHLLDEKVSNLSGGNKKMLSIELALITKPKYLIMDEPTASLDLLNQQKIMDLAHDYKAKNNSVVIITHHINEIKQCDKIVVIKNGIVAHFDSPDKIFNTDEDIVNIISNNC